MTLYKPLIKLKKYSTQILNYNFYPWNTDLIYSSKKAFERESKVIELWKERKIIYKRFIQIQNHFVRNATSFIYDPLITKASYKLE